jgi:hypothetical protein
MTISSLARHSIPPEENIQKTQFQNLPFESRKHATRKNSIGPLGISYLLIIDPEHQTPSLCIKENRAILAVNDDDGRNQSNQLVVS